MQQLLNYLHGQPQEIGEGVEYDLDRVVMVGHGFGGCTATAASVVEPDRITHTVLLDPWFLCLHKQILEEGLGLRQPVIAINSEEWHPEVRGFDSIDTLHQFFYNCAGKEDLNIMIKETGHLFMTDVLSFAPLEFKMWTGRNPSNEVIEMYELGNKVIMKWLKEYGFPDIEIKEHTEMAEYSEKKSIVYLNRPELNEKDSDASDDEPKEAEEIKEDPESTQA